MKKEFNGIIFLYFALIIIGLIVAAGAGYKLATDPGMICPRNSAEIDGVCITFGSNEIDKIPTKDEAYILIMGVGISVFGLFSALSHARRC